MSECDKLKLKKMYRCDLGDYANTQECKDDPFLFCKWSDDEGFCDSSAAKKYCKKTCNNCDVSNVLCHDNYWGKKCKKLKKDGKCCEKDVLKNCMRTCDLCGIF